METVCSSETSVDFQRTTRCYIQEDSTLQWNNYLTNELHSRELLRQVN
jgi:hypothetical protein